MSLSHSGNRKTAENDRDEKPDSGNKKTGSVNAAPKNGTHARSGSPKHSKARRKSSVIDHSNSPSKSDTKKHTTIDTHARAANTAGSAHNNETTKSHGKTTVQSRSDIHGKTSTHSPAKKSEVHKPRTNKKVEHEKNDPKKDDHTETGDTITTAVSETVEPVVDEKSGDSHDNKDDDSHDNKDEDSNDNKDEDSHDNKDDDDKDENQNQS